MELMGALWLFPVIGALVVGLFLKKNSIVERGPTGPLIGEEAGSTLTLSRLWGESVGAIACGAGARQCEYLQISG
jgi:hypothetical protein